jgi:PAS domain S-box-containing protein
VTEHIRRLRSKIEVDAQQPQLLVTVRGAGYRFDPPADPSAADGARLSENKPEAARSGIVIHVGGRIVSADAVALSLAGLTQEPELLGTDLFDLVAPASRAAARAHTEMTGAGFPQRSQVVTIHRSDGAEVLVEVASSTTQWNGQTAGRVVVTPASEPSSRLRHFATGVFGELSEAVIVTDLHAHVRSWNAAAERLYGWTESDVLGRHIIDLVPWTGDDAELAATWLSLEEQGRWYGEGRQVTRDGSFVTVLASTTLIRDDKGEPIGIVSVNRPVVATDAPASVSHTPMHDEAEIKRGIDEDEFEVYYQPVVALDDYRVVTVEALVRWNHPDRGLLTPGAFMDTAERSGLVLELGSVVFDEACRQVARWRASGADLELAVNLSTRELTDSGLVDRIAATLNSSGLDPHMLWLEVTETALVEDVDQASERLHRLAALGIRIAIDDFGTGWASLTYLRQFPVHALKIDRIFVEGIDHDPNDAAIARSIVSLGKELGLAIIAEGIETVAQQDTLKAMGCMIGQGFLYGKPTASGLVPIERAQPL